MSEPNEDSLIAAPEVASDQPDIADTIDEAVERTEGASIYDLSRRMQFAIRDFAEAFAKHMSERDVPVTDMSILINGRSDSEIKISFSSSVYQSSTSQVVQVSGYGDPIHVIDEFMERWDRTRVRAMPMITHKR